jgi:hypothetical protein
MGDSRDAQYAWVAKVLGVSVGSQAEANAAGEPDAEAMEGLVAYRKALLAFGQAKSHVAAELSALRKAVSAELPAQAELADQVAAELEALNDELADAIDEAINTSRDARAPYTAATKRLIDAYLKTISEDALMKHVDANPFVPVGISQTLTVALTNIREAMV